MLLSEDVWLATTMASDDLRLELVSGSSDNTVVRFRPGEPMDPLSLGRLGFWRIVGRGVADVHAFVYFDGEGVFVASADPGQPAYANRSPLGREWTEIVPPTELRFGDAVLALRGPAPSQLAAASSAYGASAGGNWQASAEMDFDDVVTSTSKSRQRLQKPQIDIAEDDEEPTRVAPDDVQPAPRKRRRKPKIRIPTAEEATLLRPLDEAGLGRRESAPQAQAQPQPQPWAQAMPAPPPGVQAQPPANMHLAPPPGVAGYAGPVPVAPLPAQPIAPPVAPGFLPPGVAPQPGWTPAAAPPTPSSAQETQLVNIKKPLVPRALAPYVAKALEAWKGSSIPQKAILCLLPLAFAAVFFVFNDEDSAKPAAVKPKPSASALAVASAPTLDTTGSVPAATAPPPAETSTAPAPVATPSKPSSPAGKAPAKTIERQAADAVIAGSYAEAVGLYEQLAAQHPDQPVYRESIRILRAKLSETR